MKKLYIVVLLLAIVSCKKKVDTVSDLQNATTELSEIQDWFSAWELTCKTVFPRLETKLPEFVFFDETYVYTTATVSAPKGVSVKGPSLFGQELPWLKSEHSGSITLPDERTVDIGLMSFASPLENQTKPSFFVMAMPKFWKSAGVESEDLGLKNMLTGVFLHEFSHTQQMHNFGVKISEYEQQYTFENEMNDDIVQYTFEKDSMYVKQFKQEVASLFKLFAQEVDASFIKNAKEVIANFRTRQAKYFTDDKAIFKELDDFFLTMEGTGQLAFYNWMVHPEGGNLSSEIALKGTRRGGTWWSQDQGLALCLLMDKISKDDWTLNLFDQTTVSVIDLIESGLNQE